MSILCAVDFSPCSHTAAALAAAVARRLHDSVVLLHVVEPPLFSTPEVPLDSVWALAMQEAADGAVARTARELRAEGVTVAERVLAGDASTAILQTAKDEEARLIVVGTHGRKGAGRLFLGSVAERVVRGAPCPVLVTPEGADLAGWTKDDPLRLALATDGSAAGEGALAWLADLRRSVPFGLTVIRAYAQADEAFRYGVDGWWLGEALRPELEPLLERDLNKALRAFAGAPDVQLRLRAIEGHAAQAVCGEVERLAPDALVIGAPRRRGPGAASLSPGEVLRAAGVPVLCVPEAARGATVALASPKRVLLATDLSDVSRAAIGPAYGLLRAGGGLVDLCFVHERGSLGASADLPLGPELDERERAAVEARLRALIPAEAEAFGIASRVTVVEGRTAAEALLQTAERLDVDVIALASHGRGGLNRVVIGSVADSVVRHARRPVLVVQRPGKD